MGSTCLKFSFFLPSLVLQAHLTEQSAMFIAFTFAIFLGGLTLQIAGWLELLKKNSLGGELLHALD